MGNLFALIFSKFWAVLAAVLIALGWWFRGAWLRRRAENAEARARAAEAQVAIQKTETEYAPKIGRVEEAGKSGDAEAVADMINRTWGEKK